MRENLSRRFYYQTTSARDASEPFYDDSSPYLHAAVSETSFSMGRGEALAYLSSGHCRELIGSISFREDADGEFSAEIVFREAACPSCRKGARHVLTLGEVSPNNDPDLLADAREMADRAALELRQAHIRFEGSLGYSWTAVAPPQILLTCDLCGADYYVDSHSADGPDGATGTISWLDIEKAGRRIVMRAPGERGIVTAILDTDSGFTKLGNRTLLKRATPLLRDWECSEADGPHAPFAKALLCRDILEYAKSLMPADALMPESAESRFGDPFMLLVCSNRYRGYPPSFYEHVGSYRYRILEEQYSGLNILPVEYSPHSMEDVYSSLPLPHGLKRIRRDVFEHPELVRALANFADLPFTDPNVLHDFITDEDLDRHLTILSGWGKEVPDIWFFLSFLFGDAATYGFLRKRLSEDGRFGDVLDLGDLPISIDGFDKETIEQLRRCRIADVFGSARALSGVCGGRAEDFCAPIAYTRRQRELEASAGRFLFALPKQKMQLLAAGQEMRNCLASYAERVGEGKETVLLVLDPARPAKRSVLTVFGLQQNPGRAVAAIRVDVEGRKVIESHTVCNGDMPDKGALASAYEDWKRRCNLTAFSLEEEDLF